jgi:hypothetical protein
MSASIAQVADALRTHGQACIVTQPSFYKDIFVDLPMLLSEIAHSHGLEFESGVEFDSKNSMVSVNRRAQTASRARPNETAAFYRRIDGNDK